MKITIEFDTETFTARVTDSLGNSPLILLGAMLTTARNIIDAQPINGFRQFEQGDMVTYTVAGYVIKEKAIIPLTHVRRFYTKGHEQEP